MAYKLEDVALFQRAWQSISDRVIKEGSFILPCPTRQEATRLRFQFNNARKQMPAGGLYSSIAVSVTEAGLLFKPHYSLSTMNQLLSLATGESPSWEKIEGSMEAADNLDGVDDAFKELLGGKK